MGSECISFRVDKDGWICIYDKYDKVCIAARKIMLLKKPNPGSGAHRIQEATAEEFVHIRPKQDYYIKELLSKIKQN